MRQDLRRARLRHRQARQSLRRRHRRHRRSKPTSAPSRPIPTSAFGGIIAFNRAGRRGHRRSRGRTVRRSHDRPRRSRRGAKQVLAAKTERARARSCRMARGRGNRFDFKRVGGGLLVQTPDTTNVQAAELQAWSPSAAHRRGNARPAVRLARGQVRQVERHRLLRQRPHRSASAPAR